MPELKPAEKYNEDVLCKMIASAMVGGGSFKALAEELGCNRTKIRRLYETDACKKYMKEIGDEALSTAKHKIRVGTALLVDKVIATINKGLEEGNLNAVPHALKILGFNMEEAPTQANNLQVIMPGMVPPSKPINVTPDKEKS